MDRPPDFGQPKPVDLVSTFYNAARAEMLERLKMRDQALFGYILALGAYFGFLLSRPKWPDFNEVQILATGVSPVLSLVFTLVILQHDRMVGALGAYIASELNIGGSDVRCWDRSLARKHAKDHQRFWAQLLILIAPAGYELVYSWQGLHEPGLGPQTRHIVLSAAIVSALVSADLVYLHIKAWLFRRRVRKAVANDLIAQTTNRAE